MDDELMFCEEVERLRSGASKAPASDAELHSVRVRVSGDPVRALCRARQVISAVLQHTPKDWPDNVEEPFPVVEAWAEILPAWFVDVCAPETSEDKIMATADRLGRLPSDVRELVSANTAPSLGTWISCFESYRSWLWWDADLVADGYEVKYAVFDSTYTRWDLSWLLVASGGWALEYSDLPAL